MLVESDIHMSFLLRYSHCWPSSSVPKRPGARTFWVPLPLYTTTTSPLPR